jgi:hypothetical protein
MFKTKIANPNETQPVIGKSKSVPPALLIAGGVLLAPAVLLMLAVFAADRLGGNQQKADRSVPVPVSIPEQPNPPKSQPSESSRSAISDQIDAKPETKLSPRIAAPVIFDPPSNCRTEPGTENAVTQVLAKGDVWIDLEAPQFDRKGEKWYQEKSLGCWLHHSQVSFPDQAPPTEPTKVQPSASIESVQPPQTSDSGSGYVSGTCKALRRMGLSRFTPGDPNYTSTRDRDGDGIACE